MCANSCSERGFTLVELIVVIVLLGITSVVVLPRFNVNDYRSAQFRDQVVSALRHAQKTATSHRRVVCVTFPNTSSLQLAIADVSASNTCTEALLLPGKNSSVLTSPDTTNVTFSALPANFSFDASGATTTQVITISGEAAITVTGATGHVQ